ncbi:MAG TPA: anti-sigma factor [Edaphobacter sp.]|jgi:anti-sigma-K factor RskA|nr:anti-sigma factor [Edaphobacter sp.]
MTATSLHYEAGDLALFAMQLLSEEEYRLIAGHVAACAFCRQELARLQGDLAAYIHTVEMHAPAPVVRDRVLHRIAREKKAPVSIPLETVVSSAREIRKAPSPHTEQIEPQHPIPAVEEPEIHLATRRHNGNRPQFEEVAEPRSSGSIFGKIVLGLGWIASAALAFAGMQLYQQLQANRTSISLQAKELDRLRNDAAGSRRLLDTMTSTSARHVLLSPPASSATPDPAPEGRIIYSAATGSLIFFADHLEPLDSSRIYELWLIPADGRDPIPAGTFRPDPQEAASIILPPLPRATEAKAFGVTIEDEGGSQSPTLPIVLAGN